MENWLGKTEKKKISTRLLGLESECDNKNSHINVLRALPCSDQTLNEQRILQMSTIWYGKKLPITWIADAFIHKVWTLPRVNTFDLYNI